MPNDMAVADFNRDGALAIPGGRGRTDSPCCWQNPREDGAA
jgi:hypothetical protein